MSRQNALVCSDSVIMTEVSVDWISLQHPQSGYPAGARETVRTKEHGWSLVTQTLARSKIYQLSHMLVSNFVFVYLKHFTLPKQRGSLNLCRALIPSANSAH